jgi:hypothetical protein
MESGRGEWKVVESERGEWEVLRADEVIRMEP